MKIETPYYEDMTRISNSNIGWFLKKGPAYLKGMLDGTEKGIEGKFLEKGTMIHMYLLQPEEFWDNYIILDFEVPKVKQQKDFCEAYYNLTKVDPFVDKDKATLKAYRSAYSNSFKDEIALTKAKELLDQYSTYVDYLSKSENKTVISFADLTMLKQIKSNIDNHKFASELLTDKKDYISHNEFHINWESKEGVACKSLLDRVIFDHASRKITLIDLKTTHDVYNFKHSVEEFDYYRQISYYLLAITWYMFEDQHIDISDYDFEAYIIAIQNNGSYEVRVFNMFNQSILEERAKTISEALTEISWHQSTGNWEHTRNYYEGNGIEDLE